MNTWKAILAALVIFGAGLVTGAVLHKISEKARSTVTSNPASRGTNSVAHSAQPLSLEHLRRVELMMRVQKELNLTPEQRERVEKIITSGQEHISDLWNQVEPDIQDELQQVKTKLCAELTPDQQQHFNELMKQHHKPSSSTNAPPVKVTGDK